MLHVTYSIYCIIADVVEKNVTYIQQIKFRRTWLKRLIINFQGSSFILSHETQDNVDLVSLITDPYFVTFIWRWKIQKKKKEAENKHLKLHRIFSRCRASAYHAFAVVALLAGSITAVLSITTLVPLTSTASDGFSSNSSHREEFA